MKINPYNALRISLTYIEKAAERGDVKIALQDLEQAQQWVKEIRKCLKAKL